MLRNLPAAVITGNSFLSEVLSATTLVLVFQQTIDTAEQRVRTLPALVISLPSQSTYCLIISCLDYRNSLQSYPSNYSLRPLQLTLNMATALSEWPGNGAKSGSLWTNCVGYC